MNVKDCLEDADDPCPGSESVEAFLPFTDQHCRLPNLPVPRLGHTMDGLIVCGGKEALRNI